jgi:hypothetical protein
VDLDADPNPVARMGTQAGCFADQVGAGRVIGALAGRVSAKR